MSSPWRGRVRVARAAVFALLAVLLAVGAHASGGGHVPAPLTVLVLWLAVLPVAAALAGRTWRPGALTVALGLLELGLHQALSVGSAGGPTSTAAARTRGHGGVTTAHEVPAGQHRDALPAQHPSAATDAVGHDPTTHAAAADAASAVAPDHHTGLLMLLGHVVATALTALLLAHGDALLARVWAWATLRDLPPADAPALVLRAAPPPAWRVRSAVAPLVAAGGVCRRGPPPG
ncbi:hypothetical protein [Cellulomonas cellasea]|uniref:Integral membrane protein n=1 Tax=Cellulomonas cellasea TaxID=43670 RepID=A0A7W4UI22_9CELL|nr:hypothetical protein [Cellulomonas cellasea]MBB2924546.1 hypothetical protein [Cellulomonas cellasea]